LRRPGHDTDEQERQPPSASNQVPLTDGSRDLDNYLFPIAVLGGIWAIMFLTQLADTTCRLASTA
ncbi:MAG TPA: hypothetical protein VGF32_16380, partial [Streptosporangiaceae bacterium]